MHALSGQGNRLEKAELRLAASWIAVLIVAGLLPYVLVSLMLQKRMTAQVPLCEEHRSHYSKRIWFHLIVLAVAGLFAFLLFVVPSLLGLSEDVKGQIMGGGCLFGTSSPSSG